MSASRRRPRCPAEPRCWLNFLNFLNFLGVKPTAEIMVNQLLNAMMEAGGWRPRQRGLSGAATRLFDAIAQCFGVRERQLNVLAE